MIAVDPYLKEPNNTFRCEVESCGVVSDRISVLLEYVATRVRYDNCKVLTM